jgi:hypothetical protein
MSALAAIWACNLEGDWNANGSPGACEDARSLAEIYLRINHLAAQDWSLGLAESLHHPGCRSRAREHVCVSEAVKRWFRSEEK